MKNKPTKVVLWVIHYAVLVNRAQTYIACVEKDKNATPGESCSICLEKNETCHGTKTIKCGHSFHQKCIEAWLYQQYTCPLCRAQMPRDTKWGTQTFRGAPPKPRARRQSI